MPCPRQLRIALLGSSVLARAHVRRGPHFAAGGSFPNYNAHETVRTPDRGSGRFFEISACAVSAGFTYAIHICNV